MLNVERLHKIWRLTTSPQFGEAQAALERARVIVEMEGHTLHDVPMLLGQRGSWCVDVTLLIHRVAVLRRYGSLEAATQPTPIQRAIDTAAGLFEGKTSAVVARVRRAGGFDGGEHGGMPSGMHEAVMAAWPLPSTLSEAKAEFDLWEERQRELQAVWLDPPDRMRLSQACGLRRTIVTDLLRTGLRAQSVADVLVRQRWLVDSDMMDPEVDLAVLADLEHLCQLQAAVQNGQAAQPAARSTSERRRRVLALLSNMDTAVLSDREIARRVGCSPQTVSNLRRRVIPPSRGERGFPADNVELS